MLPVCHDFLFRYARPPPIVDEMKLCRVKAAQEYEMNYSFTGGGEMGYRLLMQGVSRSVFSIFWTQIFKLTFFYSRSDNEPYVIAD